MLWAAVGLDLCRVGTEIVQVLGAVEAVSELQLSIAFILAVHRLCRGAVLGHGAHRNRSV